MHSCRPENIDSWMWSGKTKLLCYYATLIPTSLYNCNTTFLYYCIVQPSQTCAIRRLYNYSSNRLWHNSFFSISSGSTFIRFPSPDDAVVQDSEIYRLDFSSGVLCFFSPTFFLCLILTTATLGPISTSLET